MFGFSFGELALIAVVALVVLGPERLPVVAKTAGVMLGRLQRFVNGVKADVSQQIKDTELAQVRDSLQEAAKTLQSNVSDMGSSVRQSVTDLEGSLNKGLPSASSSGVDAASTPAAEAKAPYRAWENLPTPSNPDDFLFGGADAGESQARIGRSLHLQSLQKKKRLVPRRLTPPKLRARGARVHPSHIDTHHE
ncbi:MAG: twin-arginine translocase subunit TatB [Neisseriaceae bacterium]|nr:twin-arginine translocase subunit TatB [Neisseriaceae bacterium]MBP6863468.1 twin-arginine translocase subunit TatB [Neisseriaceae bacterium]